MDEARLLFLKHKQPLRELWLQQQKKGMQEEVVEPELPQEGGARERTPRARSICVRGSCANAPRSIFCLSSLFRLSTFQSGRLKHVESVPGHCQIESFRKMGMAPSSAFFLSSLNLKISSYDTQTTISLSYGALFIEVL